MENEKLLQRLESLINLGESLLKTKKDKYFENEGYVDVVDDGLFIQWWTSCSTLLSIIPDDYIYASEYEHHCHNSQYKCAELGLGILRAAKEDIETGLLQKVENLVSAEVFTDFLEMAEHLLDNGYKDPTASLIGAVLEDSLRRICKNNDIHIKGREDISSLNSKLAAKGVYNRLLQKQIQVWNDIRNNADHGNFKEYNEDDVKNMFQGVSNFLSSQLS